MPLRSMLLICCLCLSAVWSAERPQAVITTNKGAITVELFAEQAPETVANFLGLATGEKTWTDPGSGQTRNEPFYDGLTFHRVIDGFMIQGGCPLGTGTGGPGYRFADEINASALGLDDRPVFQNGEPDPLYTRDLQQLIMPKLREQGLVGPGVDRQQTMQAFMTMARQYQDWSAKRLFEELGYRYREDLPDSTPPHRSVLAMANSGPNSNGSQFFINLVDTPHLTGKHTVFGRVIDGMDVVDAIGQVAVDKASKPTTPVVIERIRPVE